MCWDLGPHRPLFSSDFKPENDLKNEGDKYVLETGMKRLISHHLPFLLGYNDARWRPIKWPLAPNLAHLQWRNLIGVLPLHAHPNAFSHPLPLAVVDERIG